MVSLSLSLSLALAAGAGCDAHSTSTTGPADGAAADASSTDASAATDAPAWTLEQCVAYCEDTVRPVATQEAAQHATCSTDEDCAAPPLDLLTLQCNDDMHLECGMPPAVRADEQQAFEDAVRAKLEALCPDVPPAMAQCSIQGSYLPTHPACVQGQCQLVED